MPTQSSGGLEMTLEQFCIVMTLVIAFSLLVLKIVEVARAK
jgi:hypothetical protein